MPEGSHCRVMHTTRQPAMSATLDAAADTRNLFHGGRRPGGPANRH